jgi:predicted DNA-binding protein (MmcQ/YjbR family)
MPDPRLTTHRRCLELPGVVLENPFVPEVDVFKVAGKMFALISTDDSPGRLTLKCDPDLAETLRAEHPSITPGYHMNKRHWITIVLDGTVSDGLIGELVEDAYALVAPRRKRVG